jgi:hypothetical protein
MAGEQGRDVVLQSTQYSMPNKCASCGGAQQTSLDAKGRRRSGNTTYTRSFQIPYCSACAARVRGVRTKGIVLAVAALGVSVVFASLGVIAPGLPAVVTIVVPIVFAVGLGVAACPAPAPPAPAAPAMGAAEAVKLVSFDAVRSTLYCENPQWGDEFAKMNGIQAIPKSRRHWFGGGALAVGLVAAPIAGIGFWVVGHPKVYVDNAGPDSLQIWLDGKKLLVAPSQPPSDATGTRPSEYIAHGKHTFGWSKVGASAPEGTVEADVTMNDGHLYNPRKTACYWLVADVYGDASVQGVTKGPQPIQEFYSFDKVDTWFGDNPQTVEVSNGETGATKVALQRAKACMEIAANPQCDLAARVAYVTCQRAAKSDDDMEKCDQQVQCMGEAKPSSAAAKGGAGAPGKGKPAPAAPGGSTAHGGGAHIPPPPAHSGKAK